MIEYLQTVIIPHPNELKKISMIQESVCTFIQNDFISGEHADIFCTPLYPQYIRPTLDETNNSKIDNEKILSCTLKSISFNGTKIIINAEIATEKEKLNCFLPIAKIYGTSKELFTKNYRQDETEFFPISLPVFRIAKVQFKKKATEKETPLEWVVINSKWAKESIASKKN